MTGRLTRGRVIGAGALSGMWLGLFVGTIFALFDPSGFNIVNVLGTVAFGAIFGAIWAMVGYRLTRGQRDFTSAGVVAAKYEVLCEHKHVARGRGPWRRWTRCGPPRRRSVGPARPRRLGSPASSRRRPTRARRSRPSRPSRRNRRSRHRHRHRRRRRSSPRRTTADLPLTRVARA